MMKIKARIEEIQHTNRGRLLCLSEVTESFSDQIGRIEVKERHGLKLGKVLITIENIR